MARNARKETIVVIGLGRFGSALAEELHDQGHEVMGMDTDEALVRASTEFLTFAEVVDATDAEALRQLGVNEVDHAVVAIGDSLQASILATATLADLGIDDIWAKAQTAQHQKILTRVGAHHTVFPERDIGRRVAHRIDSEVVDYMELDEGFVLAEMSVPKRFVGLTVLEAGLRELFGVSVVCHKPLRGSFAVTTGDTVLGASDLILLAGKVDAVDKFAALERA